MDDLQSAYDRAGVRYQDIDPFKIIAQRAAQDTAQNLLRFGFQEVQGTRGESAYLINTPLGLLAHVEEGLGTKNLVADDLSSLALAQEVGGLTGRSFYENVAKCTVAAIVNDMVTVGALPISIAMHLVVGDSLWFKNERRSHDLIRGWKNACNLARCAWGGGETAVCPDLLPADRAVLGGSAVGIVKPKKRLLRGSKIRHGDAIIFLESNGIHANGLTLARRIIKEKLPKDLLNPMGVKRTWRYCGEALLDPSVIYVPIIEECFNETVDIHYAVNITGHGWRKLMRANERFTYVIEQVPERQPIFRFLQMQGNISDEDAYATWNMGAGFAIYVASYDAQRVVEVARRHNILAFHAGYIEKRRGKEKSVIIKPKGVVYESSTLQLR